MITVSTKGKIFRTGIILTNSSKMPEQLNESVPEMRIQRILGILFRSLFEGDDRAALRAAGAMAALPDEAARPDSANP